ncbi:Homeodomain-like protein [Cynara cardunculus var. scolymus]|uniref:Homeodomain-like protein n=1 Tax=Cynara cardunculus var. scolymus TaxID=59895 RepID=A0A124SFM7_CYNCS|nr:Homeodomain-like protein [Cynara cardunculus var. scolymus]
MAASANPSANNNGSTSNGNDTNTTTINNGGRSSVPENSGVGPSQRALKHSVDLSVQWSSDEQSLLEELLVKYASDNRVMRYAKIAGKLQDKTARDVALRCKWMTKKEIGKRRKDDNLSRKHKDKKEKLADQLAKPSSHATNRANAIGGVSGQLLEQNAQALDQISANFSALKCLGQVNSFR